MGNIEKSNTCGFVTTIAYDKLKAENDKLRELVRRAHGCKTDDGYCEDCWDGYDECPIEAEMRELGIEVD